MLNNYHEIGKGIYPNNRTTIPTSHQDTLSAEVQQFDVLSGSKNSK